MADRIGQADLPAVVEQPEPRVHQRHHKQRSSLPLPELFLPAAPEQVHSRQATPGDRDIEPQPRGVVDDPDNELGAPKRTRKTIMLIEASPGAMARRANPAGRPGNSAQWRRVPFP